MATGEVVNITAGVEDLAQALSDRVIFVAVDGIAESELGSRYGVEAYPEFVLLSPGQPDTKFEGMQYDSWNISDVAAWLEANGYEPAGPMFNIYHVSPHETQNPDEFVTEICYPVKKK